MTWVYTIGALFYLALAALAVCLVLIAFIHWRESRRWRRFSRACGSEKSAMSVLLAAEASLDVATDVIGSYGMKAAVRHGLLPERFH